MTKKAAMLFFVLAFCSAFAQSFLINFPAFSTAPTKNPQDITIANGTSKLQVQMVARASSASGATVTIQLAPGIEYITGTATVVSTNAGLTITDNGGTPNAPQFKIADASGGIANSNTITFTIERKAVCAARSEVLLGTIFKDTVTGTVTGSPASSETSGVYAVKYAVLSFTQPAPLNNAVINTTHTRTFSMTNGGNGSVAAVYLTVTNTGATITNSITLTGGTGSAGTPVVITPTSGVYIIPAANLSGGTLDNGETLTFEESYTVKQCNGVTEYKIGWGSSPAEADWCDTKTGSGNVTMAAGVPDLSVGTAVKDGFVDSCTPFTTKFSFKNSGSGKAAAGGMYNVKFRFGNGDGNQPLTGSFTRRDYINFVSAKIGTQSGITVVNGSGPANTIAYIDVENLFTTDPDGPGVGLDDLDGDGFYDDLPVGATVNIDMLTKVNCNAFPTCPQEWINQYDGFSDIRYQRMCGGAFTNTATRTFGSLFASKTTQLADKSYAPANVYDGVPFRARFSVGYYYITNPFDTDNTRYVYEVTLPAGMSVSGGGNAIWRNGQYPDNASSAGTAVTFTQTGNVLTITSPAKNMGWFEIDLVFNCGTATSPMQIPYKLKRLDNIATGCICNPELFCGNATIGMVHCPAPCPNGDPSLSFAKVERADNSLGWTDGNLTTKQSKSNISAYDLSKALYLDEIEVTAHGVIGSAALSDFFLYFGINKLGGTNDKLTPKNIDVLVTRAGSTIYTGTLTSFTTTGTSTTKQVTRWDLSALVAVGLLPGDKVETLSRYTVSTNSLPTNDMQTGESIYFYGATATDAQASCNSATPEMYLVGAAFIDLSNNPTQSACNVTSIGGATHNLAYRFNAAGTKYITEIRPGFLPKKLTFTLPVGYTLNDVRFGGNDVVFPAETLTPVLVSGTVSTGLQYTVDIPARQAMNITVTNSYAAFIDVRVIPTCSAPNNSPYKATIEYIPYYYHNKEVANPPTATNSKTLNVVYNTTTRPQIKITNLSGSIQATKPTESFTVNVASIGGSTAPYIWLKVPAQAGATVTQVEDVATGTMLSPITYSGGVWFKLSDTGIAPAGSKDYKVYFTYTSCTPSSINIEAGWDCAGYPANPDNYACSTSTANLPFTPIAGQVQVQSVSQLVSPVPGLCSPLDYEFRVNSAGGGNIKDVKFGITQVSGMTVDPASIFAEYPAGANNWTAVSYTTVGNETILDLTTHPAYPANGIPGTLNDGGVTLARQFGVKFSMTTYCNFVSGSNFTVTPYANNSCGSATTGSGAASASNSVSVAGADPAYLVSSVINLDPATAFNACASPITLPIEQTITSLTSTGTTGTVRIDLPAGYDFAGNTITCTGTFCPTVDGVYTDAVTSTRYMILNVPAGMNSGDKMTYSVDILNATPQISCGTHQINIKSFDKIGSLSCPTAPGGVCTDVTVQTGKLDYEFEVSKPVYTIDAITGTPAGSVISGNITISNTTGLTSASDINVNFYCADAAGNPTGTVIGTAVVSAVAANSTATYAYSFTASSTCPAGKIYAIIEQGNNCACSSSNGVTFSTACYKPGATAGTVLATNHGITALGRAGADNGNWPMVRKGAWTVLEAKTKGFVVNRLTDTQMNAISAANLVEGMMIYNITQQCLMINIDGTASGWKCYGTPACPD